LESWVDVGLTLGFLNFILLDPFDWPSLYLLPPAICRVRTGQPQLLHLKPCLADSGAKRTYDTIFSAAEGPVWSVAAFDLPAASVTAGRIVAILRILILHTQRL